MPELIERGEVPHAMIDRMGIARRNEAVKDTLPLFRRGVVIMTNRQLVTAEALKWRRWPSATRAGPTVMLRRPSERQMP